MGSWKISLTVFLYFCFFSMKVFSMPQITVKSMAQGACWVDQEKPVRVASFNEQTSFYINEGFIKDSVELIRSELDHAFFRLPHDAYLSATYHLYCSGQGVSFIVNAELESKKRVCAWFDVERGKPIIAQWGLSEQEDFCYGQAVGEVVVGVGEASFDEIMEELYLIESWDQKIVSHVQLGERSGLLYIDERWWGQEIEIIEKLRKTNFFRYVEHSNIYHPIGDHLDL